MNTEKEMLTQDTERKLREKVKVISQLEQEVEGLKVTEEELQRNDNAVSMVTMLQAQLEVSTHSCTQ